VSAEGDKRLRRAPQRDYCPGVAVWVIWVILAGALGLAELHTLTLVLGMLAIAALPAAVVAGLGGDAALQVLTFAGGSVLLLGVVRPVARRHRHLPAGLRTGAAALVGQRGTVVAAVDSHDGRVRIGGEVWSARLYAEDSPVPAGQDVDVIAIDGATALVLPLRDALYDAGRKPGEAS
jgi:membrane protein implicated in regulation of membrane protease activity